jgi:hypothetical protein
MECVKSTPSRNALHAENQQLMIVKKLLLSFVARLFATIVSILFALTVVIAVRPFQKA